MTDRWRYMVTLQPGVAIAARRFIEVVDVDHPDPFAAIEKAISIWRKRDEQDDEPGTHIWQSDDASVRVERVP